MSMTDRTELVNRARDFIDSFSDRVDSVFRLPRTYIRAVVATIIRVVKIKTKLPSRSRVECRENTERATGVY